MSQLTEAIGLFRAIDGKSLEEQVMLFEAFLDRYRGAAAPVFDFAKAVHSIRATRRGAGEAMPSGTTRQWHEHGLRGAKPGLAHWKKLTKPQQKAHAAGWAAGGHGDHPYAGGALHKVVQGVAKLLGKQDNKNTASQYVTL